VPGEKDRPFFIFVNKSAKLRNIWKNDSAWEWNLGKGVLWNTNHSYKK
jgi:hypothetical protein